MLLLSNSLDTISRKHAAKDLSYILPSLSRLIASQMLTLLGYIITSILKIHIVYAVALVMLFFLLAALSSGKASFKQNSSLYYGSHVCCSQSVMQRPVSSFGSNQGV
jgi:hypothetical protein